jgi:hypothetical protein
MPQTPGVYLGLFADDTCIYVTDGKEVLFSDNCSKFSVLLRPDVSTGTKISEDDKTWVMYFSHRLRPPEDYLKLNEWHIPFVNHIKYLCVILDKRITWRPHIEMIEAKAFKTFIRIHSLFKSECLIANIKLSLHKALIRSVMTYACPTWELAADTYLLKLQRL